jgi:putative nucleotidyltransferase with HDIG domain
MLSELVSGSVTLARSEETRRVVERVVDLPTLPAVTAQVFRVVEDERSSAQDLASVIATDQSLTSRILRLANSAFYGFPRAITSVNQAVVLLGFGTVKGLVLAATVAERLAGGEGSSFDRERFWLHTVGVANAARIVARSLRGVPEELAYVAGLLHDIGKLVLDRFFVHEYSEAALLARRLPCLIRDAELTVLGLDHAEVGGRLMERWRLATAIVVPVAYHHRPAMAPPEHWGVAATVHLADVLTRNAGIGEGGETLVPLPDAEVLSRLRVTPDTLAQWTESLATEREAVETFFRGMG